MPACTHGIAADLRWWSVRQPLGGLRWPNARQRVFGCPSLPRVWHCRSRPAMLLALQAAPHDQPNYGCADGRKIMHNLHLADLQMGFKSAPGKKFWLQTLHGALAIARAARAAACKRVAGRASLALRCGLLQLRVGLRAERQGREAGHQGPVARAASVALGPLGAGTAAPGALAPTNGRCRHCDRLRHLGHGERWAALGRRLRPLLQPPLRLRGVLGTFGHATLWLRELLRLPARRSGEPASRLSSCRTTAGGGGSSG